MIDSDALHVVCPHCSTTNRVAKNQLSQTPTCGRCKQLLFTGATVDLDDVALFDRHLTRNQIPMLVDFWASWCGPCRMMAPAYEEAAASLEPHVRVTSVNTEAAQALSARYQVRSIPTLALFVDGKIVARHSGAMTNPVQIVQWVRTHLPAA